MSGKMVVLIVRSGCGLVCVGGLHMAFGSGGVLGGWHGRVSLPAWMPFYQDAVSPLRTGSRFPSGMTTRKATALHAGISAKHEALFAVS
jgi:hypothetical protein